MPAKTDLELSEYDVLACDVADATLEDAAGSWSVRAGSMTVSYCSGLDSCPA
jgi:hypothetical protein